MMKLLSPKLIFSITCSYYLLLHYTTHSLTFQPNILPGTGLISMQPDKTPNKNVEIVIFEYTEQGSGGLVLNAPTPILLRDLNIPRFTSTFGSNVLMLGCGISEKTDGDSNQDSNISMGDMAPWYWIHDLDHLSGSFRLEGADDDDDEKGKSLYMGGNIEEATKRIRDEQLDPVQHFKFFWKAHVWKRGELQRELEEGYWIVRPQSVKRALRVYKMPRIE